MERVYSGSKERTRKTNTVIALGCIIVSIIYVITILLEPGIFVEKLPILKIIGAVAVGVLAITNLILAFSGMEPERAATIITISILFAYCVCDVLSTDVYAPYLVFAPILAFVMYYEKKRIIVPAVFAFVFGVATKIFDLTKLADNPEEFIKYSIAIGFLIAFTATAYVVSRLSEKFNNDIFGSIEDGKKVQEQNAYRLGGVLETVTKETGEISKELDELLEASQHITESINLVADGSHETAGSIERQLEMTEAIGQRIEGTAQKAEEITRISATVNEAVISGNKAAGELNGLSADINATNRSVTDAMNRLIESTTAMQTVVDTIVSISAQTTLLALNASIEAARAGEAGRGFSVVADEIRNLSEQTKNSTEDIRSLISGLNDEATKAASAVAQSVEATQRQAEFIDNIDKQFDSIETDMGILASNVVEIKELTEDLIDDNAGISTSISSIAGRSQEAIANADIASDAAESNRESVERVRTSLSKVLDCVRSI